MRKVLFFDAFNGVSGDMILGALIDLGVPLDHLREQLSGLDLGGYHLQVEPVERQGLWGRNFQVVEGSEPAADHHHHHPDTFAPDDHGDHHHHDHDQHEHHREGHHHHHRTWAGIRRMIVESRLDPQVKDQSLAVFERLARAEASVHRTSVEDVHFHEVGAVDSIVDIVGACIGFRYLDIDEFYASALNLGGGTVTFSHGTWPVPAPATVELVRGFPTRLSEVPFELTTPTGAAIVTTLVKQDCQAPRFQIKASGFGAGDRSIPGIPNMLRLILGEYSPGAKADDAGTEDREQIAVLEANLDNLDPETIGHFLDVALREGALDVYFSPIQMKKNRPAVLVSVLCRPDDRGRIARLLFRETSTLGVRGTLVDRWVLPRREQVVETEFGPVRFKLGELDGKTIQAAPEFEDLKRIAEQTGLPLKEIRRRVMARF